MFCTKCGKTLPADGSPCTCQAQAPAAQTTEAVPEAATYEAPAAEEIPEAPAAEPAEEIPAAPAAHYDNPAPAYAPLQPNPYAYPAPHALPVTPVHTAIKTLASSPIFLCAVIALTASVLFSIVNSFFASSVDWVNYLPEELRYQFYSFGYDSLGNAATINFSVFFQLVVVIGPWLIFAAAMNKNQPVMSTGGFTVIRVFQIIGLVAMCALGVICLVCGVILIIAGVNDLNSYGSVVAGLLAFLLFAILLLIVFYILYLAKLIGSIKAVKTALMTGMVGRKMSMFVVVVNFLIAIYLLVDLYGVFAMGNVWQGFSNLCSAASYVLFSLCMVKYNAMVKSFMTPPVAYQAPYQPPYQP